MISNGIASVHMAETREAIKDGPDLSTFVNSLQHGVKDCGYRHLLNADGFEAITTVPVQEEAQKGVVIDCVQKGYQLNDKIIRYPKVIVGE